jgi:hypothetical protein
VILAFGNISLPHEGRIFLLSEPDFEAKDQPVDINEVYIDTKTCDSRLLERFISYILHYPPKHGVQSVKIFYKGELGRLGNNLRNALQNTFEHIHRDF